MEVSPQVVMTDQAGCGCLPRVQGGRQGEREGRLKIRQVTVHFRFCEVELQLLEAALQGVQFLQPLLSSRAVSGAAHTYKATSARSASSALSAADSTVCYRQAFGCDHPIPLHVC